MSDHFVSTLAPCFDVRPLQPVGALNVIHVCGTCRFGDDPRASVLDRDNRAHDLDNPLCPRRALLPVERGDQPEPDHCREQLARQRQDRATAIRRPNQGPIGAARPPAVEDCVGLES